MNIIDLTMTIQEGMQTFAAHWHPVVEITQLGRHGIENRETRRIVLGTHTGTHVDAPRHFVRDGETVDNIPLDTLCGSALIVDFSNLPDFHEITVNELENKITGPVERLLFRFDWDKKALMTNRYYSDHPFFSEEAVMWLVDKRVKLICMDTPQPDNPLNGRNSGNDAPVHKILLSGGVILTEYLVNMCDIKNKTPCVVVAPLKILGADGAPARCFVIE